AGTTTTPRVVVPPRDGDLPIALAPAPKTTHRSVDNGERETRRMGRRISLRHLPQESRVVAAVRIAPPPPPPAPDPR
ncbi:MAG TPA: hypothetical protein VFJ74_07970, partial [Gemmatimonadaceae bacterium]|nr:hypothetical protein [Gemmatimonadaceae bacterium]